MIYSLFYSPYIAHYNIVFQLSYAAISPLLDNKERYPRFYRLVPSVIQYFEGYHVILKYFNWRRVAVIYYDDEFTLSVC